MTFPLSHAARDVYWPCESMNADKLSGLREMWEEIALAEPSPGRESRAYTSGMAVPRVGARYAASDRWFYCRHRCQALGFV
jgi:hypothetical protein